MKTFFQIKVFNNTPLIDCLVYFHFTIFYYMILDLFYKKNRIIQNLIDFTNITEDLTKLKEQEKIIELQYKQIATKARLTSLGEMSAGIAHEINNPLTSIKGRILLMKESLKNPDLKKEELLNWLNSIDKTTERIAAIIKGFRVFSRDSGHDPFELTPMKTILDDTLNFCSSRFEKYGFDLKINYPENLVVECRKVQISQVLLNLLNNAFDATNKLPNPWIGLDVSRHDDTVIITVTDCGTGIPQDIQDKMKEPFFTTKPAGLGTGLGLSISRGLIESHHGKLYLDNNSPNTRFVIEIPIRQALKPSIAA